MKSREGLITFSIASLPQDAQSSIAWASKPVTFAAAKDEPLHVL